MSGTVTVWDYEYKSFPPYTKAIEKIDADFERQNPGVKVERVAQPLENYESLVRTAFTSRETPDLMMMLPGALGVLQFKQGLEVVNDRISPEMEDSLIGWETATAGFGEEGERYGVPVGLSGTVFYYNKQLFEKAGLPADFQPKSWAEIKAAGEKLKAAGIEAFSAGDKEGLENNMWFSAGWQSANTPEQAIELAEGKMPFTDPAVAKAFGPEFEMQEAGLFPSDRFSVPQFTEAQKRFLAGEAGMMFGFWNSVLFWGEAVPALGEQNVGIFFPPEGNYVGYETDHVLSMPTSAKNKDAAWALVEYETTPEAMQILADEGANLPNRDGVKLPADAPVQPQEIVEHVQAGREAGELFPYTHIMIPGAIDFGPMATEVNEALQGRASLADAQAAMQETMEKAEP